MIDHTTFTKTSTTKRKKKSYKTCATKRSRRTKAQMQDLRDAIYEVCRVHQPLTVRQCFYRLMAARGFSSKTFLYKAAQVLRRYWDEFDWPCHIAYFGDHDPSGVHIDRDIRTKLERYGATNFTFERIAVTPEQIEAWGLPGSPPKKTDTRSRNWKGEAVEIESIAPGDLRRLCESYIEGFINNDALDRCQLVEQAEKDTLAHIIENMGGEQ